MPDYKEMYFKIFRAAAQAADILITVQQECEALYMAAGEPELKVVAVEGESKNSGEERG